MIYLDSCALLKLVITEPESAALREYMAEQSQSGVVGFASELAHVEVRRALIRREATQDRHVYADKVLGDYAKLPIAPAIPAASRLPHQHLASLDALHLATAASLGHALTQFITYDKQLSKFAEEAGLPVFAPGV
ncbi:MAG TPA: type II toxin-antitoxin system VapC family toxin [Pseudonocardiaceae bacterium]|nr:type II toxin-antitoxin system VapC family toxin [Pseudonocardiaceae bacterium]